MGEYSKKRVYIIVGGFIFVVLLIIVFFIIRSMQNPYGDEIKITNLNNYTAGKPSNNNMIDSTQRNLLLTVNMNQKKPISGSEITDAVVRKDTFSQKYDTQYGVHSVGFIVDIASLHQSYKATYQWADNGRLDHIDEYGTGVTCLAIDQLKYGDFNCIDSLIQEKGKENYDPVEKILPYVVKYKYAIKDYTTIPERGEVTLKVEAFVPSWSNKEDTLGGYTTEIKAWLKQRKLDPGKYNLDFIY